MFNAQFVIEHKDDDVRSLALRKMPEGVNALWVLQQIEGYQLAKKKIPAWAEKLEEGIMFPPRISMEQCSSELTAKYKKKIIESLLEKSETHDALSKKECEFVDLNGGFGVDFSYMAQGLGRSVYVEQNEELCSIAKNNFPILELPSAEIYNEKCEDFLSHSLELSDSTRIIYLDPARRDTHGRKVVTIEDCMPDVTKLQDILLQSAEYVMIKLSPMLDITAALRCLHNVIEVHVVSVKGECKELLFVVKGGDICNNIDVRIFCVNLNTDEEELICTLSKFPLIQYSASISADNYLFEPNASILKAGVQDVFGNYYGLRKLHPMSNLYVGDNIIYNVPARQFRIVGISDFSKVGLKKILKGIDKANLTIRNFPSDVATLRKRLKIKEGGNDYLFATTLLNGSHALLHCVRC